MEYHDLSSASRRAPCLIAVSSMKHDDKAWKVESPCDYDNCWTLAHGGRDVTSRSRAIGLYSDGEVQRKGIQTILGMGFNMSGGGKWL